MISPSELIKTLRPTKSVTETKVVTIPPRPPKADIIFSFDLTGSMLAILNTAKTKAIDLMNALDVLGVDINYGVTSHMDYPHFYANFHGYTAQYGSPGVDYAYQLNQSITSDRTVVSSAINSLIIGNGVDFPENYTRVFYESYADPSVGWRPGARRIFVHFGDDVPHDDNINQGLPKLPQTTGGDPGRDEVANTPDDLDLQNVLNEMALNGVVLLECHTTNDFIDNWEYWAGITGGKAFITSSASLIEDLVIEITSLLSNPTVSNLHLIASPGYEAWLTSVTPPSYPSVPTGESRNFTIIITVPAGTPPGEYTFLISAIADETVNYGDQTVRITVPCRGCQLIYLD
ncbi:hypothetical protein CPJCM30710_07040 [Clostridium polyendosporum]|uniref:VWFA domain-containing protein n=1 Tax=Clostridium polyendosporum TaxID=69208 RepID=A0A919VKY2_9CLOT|nr:vWA domain-containing protein [Clostridium polyendosporum]GIM28038.1 hypothetical protein CPJCM30710_07040 [Clostridium polyendosporum]